MNKPNEVASEFKYGKSGDAFKPLTEVLLSDVRQTFWARLQSDGTMRAIQFEDLHKSMSELNLNSTVPEGVRTGFDTARNLFLYSWFVYRFVMVASLQAYATLEFALGKRINIEKARYTRGLSNRLDFAIENGWLRAEGVRRYRESAARQKRFAEEQERLFKEILKSECGWQSPDKRTETQRAAEYLQGLKQGTPLLRNSVAHGEPMLGGGTVVTLEICCDLINQLFPEKSAG